MKLKVLFIYFLLTSTFTMAQQESSMFFGQCMLDIETNEEITQLETEMRQNPYLRVVRLDTYSKRAFILTNNMESLSEEEFISWFNEHSDKVRCIQVGRHGVDAVKPFPFEGCEN